MVKVLVIDDSKVIRNLLTDYLNDLGYVVELAIDGQEGIEKAVNNDYNIIICDIHMPKRNGYQVYNAIIAEKPDISFIMTDSLPGDLAKKSEDAGVKYLLTKPFDLEQLKETLDKIIQISKQNERT